MLPSLQQKEIKKNDLQKLLPTTEVKGPFDIMYHCFWRLQVYYELS